MLHTIYSAYIDKKLTLEEFESRLAPLLPRVFESSDPSVNELAGIAELGLSEIDAGILNEDEFGGRLREALDGLMTVWFEFSDLTEGITDTASSNRVTASPELIQIQAAV